MRSDQSATATSPPSKTPSILRVSFQCEPHQSSNNPQKNTTRMQNAEGPGSRVLVHLGLGLCSRAPLRDVAFPSLQKRLGISQHCIPPPPPARLDNKPKMRDWARAHHDGRPKQRLFSAACGLSRMQRGERQPDTKATQRWQQVKKSLHRYCVNCNLAFSLWRAYLLCSRQVFSMSTSSSVCPYMSTHNAVS